MSAAPDNQNTEASSLSLGDLLYADPRIACIPEKDWLALVRAVAAGEKSSLRLLFDKTYPLVFAYLMLCTGDRRIAENLTLEVFEILWCEAPVFDGASSPVLGWVMRHARASALAYADTAGSARRRLDAIAMNLLDDAPHGFQPSDPRLQTALEHLTAVEREVIEAAFIHGLSYSELAQRQGKPVGTIKKIIHDGLAKLRHWLQESGGGA